MIPIRIMFTKTDEAKYISHLDLTRNMQRVIKRAGVPIWYTQGFNPHPFMTFALPLSLGTDGLHETMDVKLLDENMDFSEIKERLNDCMPLGIHVTDVYEPVMKHTQICFAKFEILLSGCDSIYEDFNEFLNQPSIIATKKTKSGKIKEMELKSLIREYSLEKCDNGAVLSIILPAGCTDNINPSLLTDAFSQAYYVPESIKTVRRKLFTENMEVFR